MRRALAWRYWPGHLLLVVVVVATTLLGMWQFSVSERHKQDALNKRLVQPAVAMTSVFGPNDVMTNNLVGKKVTVTGTFLPGTSALQVTGTDSAIYVETSDTSATSITGWLEPSGYNGVNLVDQMSKISGDLYSAILVTQRPATVSSGSSWTTGLRNLLYALEWWVFGVFAFWVWWRWLRDSLDAPVGSDESLIDTH